MWRRLFSSLTDELAGVSLLYGVMRHGGRPPRVGPAAGVAVADLLSGDPARTFGPAPAAADWAAARLTLPAEKKRREAAKVAGCGAVWEFAFPTSEPTGVVENDTVRGRVWRAADPATPRRCVLALDGIVQAGFGNLRAFAAETCPSGIDLATVDLPFNHRRTPPGYRPGQLILGGDLAHVLSVLRQTARDAAAAVRTLRESGEYPGGVGLAGISFGGWTAAQTAALLGSVWREIGPPRWACGVCPAADLLDELTAGGPLVRAARRNLGLSPSDRDRLAGVGACIRPSEYSAPLPGDRLAWHVAEYDRFVANAAVERLAARWGGAVMRHKTGHMGLAAAPHYLHKVARGWPAMPWEPEEPGEPADSPAGPAGFGGEGPASRA